MFAMSMENGKPQYLGEVVSESGDMLRIRVCDAVCLVMAGLLVITDELIDVDNKSCRKFLTSDSMMDAYSQSARQASAWVGE